MSERLRLRISLNVCLVYCLEVHIIENNMNLKKIISPSILSVWSEFKGEQVILKMFFDLRNISFVSNTTTALPFSTNRIMISRLNCKFVQSHAYRFRNVTKWCFCFTQKLIIVSNKITSASTFESILIDELTKLIISCW